MRMSLLISLLLAVATAASAQGSAARPALRRDGTASVQFMITNAMVESLVALGYTAEDIKVLSPDRAAAIIDNGIARPRQGVPSSWTRTASRRGSGKKSPLVQAIGGITRVLAAGLATAVALHMSGMDLGEFSRIVDVVAESLLESTRR